MIQTRRWMTYALGLCLFAGGAMAAPKKDEKAKPAAKPAAEKSADAAKPAAKKANDGEFVCSKDGETFHMPDCPNAQKIKAENKVWVKDLKEAAAKKLTACKVCHPDQAEKTQVTVSENGGAFHTSADCPSCKQIKNPKKMSEAEASKEGYTACKNCVKMEEKKDK